MRLLAALTLVPLAARSAESVPISSKHTAAQVSAGGQAQQKSPMNPSNLLASVLGNELAGALSSGRLSSCLALFRASVEGSEGEGCDGTWALMRAVHFTKLSSRRTTRVAPVRASQNKACEQLSKKMNPARSLVTRLFTEEAAESWQKFERKDISERMKRMPEFSPATGRATTFSFGLAQLGFGLSHGFSSSCAQVPWDGFKVFFGQLWWENIVYAGQNDEKWSKCFMCIVFFCVFSVYGERFKSHGFLARLWPERMQGRAKSHLRPRFWLGFGHGTKAKKPRLFGLRPKPVHHYLPLSYSGTAATVFARIFEKLGSRSAYLKPSHPRRWGSTETETDCSCVVLWSVLLGNTAVIELERSNSVGTVNPRYASESELQIFHVSTHECGQAPQESNTTPIRTVQILYIYVGYGSSPLPRVHPMIIGMFNPTPIAIGRKSLARRHPRPILAHISLLVRSQLCARTEESIETVTDSDTSGFFNAASESRVPRIHQVRRSRKKPVLSCSDCESIPAVWRESSAPARARARRVLLPAPASAVRDAPDPRRGSELGAGPMRGVALRIPPRPRQLQSGRARSAVRYRGGAAREGARLGAAREEADVGRAARSRRREVVGGGDGSGADGVRAGAVLGAGTRVDRSSAAAMTTHARDHANSRSRGRRGPNMFLMWGGRREVDSRLESKEEPVGHAPGLRALSSRAAMLVRGGWSLGSSRARSGTQAARETPCASRATRSRAGAAACKTVCGVGSALRRGCDADVRGGARGACRGEGTATALPDSVLAPARTRQGAVGTESRMTPRCAGAFGSRAWPPHAHRGRAQEALAASKPAATASHMDMPGARRVPFAPRRCQRDGLDPLPRTSVQPRRVQLVYRGRCIWVVFQTQVQKYLSKFGHSKVSEKPTTTTSAVEPRYQAPGKRAPRAAGRLTHWGFFFLLSQILLPQVLVFPLVG
ncbi:hypothetical protein DFH09DRAFT_1447361 [Mycena vulgaris]|nr:hypothetical protein DFH09DRAFT_1447361 [Mycena vulgaris]